MIHTHKLDKPKIEKYLHSKGWRRGLNHEWEVPSNFNEAQLEEIWTEAILQGIVCQHEVKSGPKTQRTS